MASNSAPKLPKLPKLSKHRSISQGMSKEKAQLRFKDDKLASQMLVVMNESRLSDRYCDIKLLIRENEDAEPITAHKLVLISFSCYFEGLLSSNMKEGSQDEIRIHNLHAPSVQNLVEFAYTGSILITSDNIEVLLEAANFLAVDSVCQACCKFLAENMNPENCVGIMGCADVYGFMTLHEKAFRFARDNFFQVAQSDEIENLPFENLKQLISSERLYEGGQIIPMPSVQEKVVLKVVCKFIHANNLVGSKESLELFKQVRMSLLEQEDVDSLFQSNVTKNNTDLEALIQERRSREAGSVLDTAIPYWCRPRKYPGLTFLSSSIFDIGIGTGYYKHRGRNEQSFTGKQCGEESYVNGVKLWIRRQNNYPKLEGIQLFYRNGKTTTHGGTTAKEQYQFYLDDTEYIVDIGLRSGLCMDQFTFHTSRGRVFGPYSAEARGEKTVEKPDDGFLVYFTGQVTEDPSEDQGANIIYQLQFIWGYYDYAKL